MKKTDVLLKVIKKTPSFVLFLFFLYSCTGKNCADIEKNISKNFTNIDTVYTIKLSQYDKIKWDSLFVIQGPRFPVEIKKIIGTNYPYKALPDDSNLFIAIKDSAIIYRDVSFCRLLKFYKINRGTGFVKLTSNSVIKIKRIGSSKNDGFNVISVQFLH